jgi:hypothetical protein
MARDNKYHDGYYHQLLPDVLHSSSIPVCHLHYRNLCDPVLI